MSNPTQLIDQVRQRWRFSHGLQLCRLERHAEARTLAVFCLSRISAVLLDGGDDFLTGSIWALGVLITLDVVDDTCGTQIPEGSSEIAHSPGLEAGRGSAWTEQVVFVGRRRISRPTRNCQDRRLHGVTNHLLVSLAGDDVVHAGLGLCLFVFESLEEPITTFCTDTTNATIIRAVRDTNRGAIVAMSNADTFEIVSVEDVVFVTLAAADFGFARGALVSATRSRIGLRVRDREFRRATLKIAGGA